MISKASCPMPFCMTTLVFVLRISCNQALHYSQIHSLVTPPPKSFMNSCLSSQIHLLKAKSLRIRTSPPATFLRSGILTLHLPKQIARPRTRIRLPRTSPPPPETKNSNKASHHHSIIHIRARDRLHSREHQHHTNEEHPRNRNSIQRFLPLSERERSRHKRDSAGVEIPREDDERV